MYITHDIFRCRITFWRRISGPKAMSGSCHIVTQRLLPRLIPASLIRTRELQRGNYRHHFCFMRNISNTLSKCGGRWRLPPLGSTAKPIFRRSAMTGVLCILTNMLGQLSNQRRAFSVSLTIREDGVSDGRFSSENRENRARQIGTQEALSAFCREKCWFVI